MRAPFWLRMISTAAARFSDSALTSAGAVTTSHRPGRRNSFSFTVERHALGAPSPHEEFPARVGEDHLSTDLERGTLDRRTGFVPHDCPVRCTVPYPAFPTWFGWTPPNPPMYRNVLPEAA